MTTRLTGGLNWEYKPRLQALLLLTHHLSLKDAFVLLTIIADTLKKHPVV